MSYFVKSDYSGYYIANAKDDVSDIAVTQRPHVVCEWDGAAWTYPIASARDYQKQKVADAMTTDVETILASNYAAIGMIEATAFEDNTGRSSDSVAFLNGYKLQRADATLQDAADDMQTRYALPMAVFGKALAQRGTLFDQIDAETDGETALTYNWVAL
jgi:hypothetical protein